MVIKSQLLLFLVYYYSFSVCYVCAIQQAVLNMGCCCFFLGEVCSHAGVRHPPAQRAAGYEGQVLELCLLQVHLRVWSDERAGDARDAVLVCVVRSSRHSTAV